VSDYNVTPQFSAVKTRLGKILYLTLYVQIGKHSQEWNAPQGPDGKTLSRNATSC